MLQISTQPTAPQYPTYPEAAAPSLWHQVGDSLGDSMHRVLVNLASFLPGLLALLVALVVLTAIGLLLSYLLRVVLIKLHFDERLNRSYKAGVSDFSPANSPTLLVSRAALWGCVIIGFVIGISAFDASYATNSQVSIFLLPYITHSIGSILLLVAGTLLARFLSRSVLIGAVNAKVQYARFLALGVKWLVLVLTAAMVLDHLGIGGTIVELGFGILFGGIVLTLSLAVGLGSRDIVSRSLERNADRLPQMDATAEATGFPRGSQPAETLRHF